MRTAPATCSGGSVLTGGGRRQAATTASTPRNETALRTKTGPGPEGGNEQPTERRPQRSGRAVNAAPLSEIAAGSSARGTISGVIAQNTGSPTAVPTPRAAVKPSSSPGVAASASVTAPSPAATSSCQPWVAMIIRRRSTTSARAPPGSASTKAGSDWAVWTSATSAADAVSDVMSHDAATSCIQVPRFETRVASQIARNRRLRSGVHGDAEDEFLDAPQERVAASVEQERLCLRVHVQREHLADEDQVVARVVGRARGGSRGMPPPRRAAVSRSRPRGG